MIENVIATEGFWAHLKKFIGLFIMTYLVLYMFPYPLSETPVVSEVFSYYDEAINFLTLWFGHNILGLTTLEKIEITGSGDTSFDYVKLLATTIFAILISMCLFGFTYKRNYGNLYDKVSTYARYYLGLTLISYGFAKVFDGQFLFPSIFRLEQSYGNSSPMGLLWAFMGYSKPYSMFGGLCEILAGFLLFFRNTSVIGSLISMFVMVNVVMLNFAYDVPVKLYASHLLLISFFIFSPYLIHLFDFFVRSRSRAIRVPSFVSSNQFVRYGRILLKTLMVIVLPALMIRDELSYLEENKPNHKLQGAYFTQLFLINHDTIAYDPADSIRWSKLLIDKHYSKIVFANDQSIMYDSEVDTLKRTIRFSPKNDTVTTYILKYDHLSDSTFSINVQYKSDTISAIFKSKRMEDYLLVNRGFHWISEYPHNR
jgi:hypothetical protein